MNNDRTVDHMTPEISHTLDGRSLNEAVLADIAAGATVRVDEAHFKKMEATNRRIQEAVADGTPVYGVTTGLGPKVVQALSADEIEEFSLNTVRGRAHSVGEPLTEPVVRAALAIRLNTLLCGASGASPDIARLILSCLNARLTPHVGNTTSTGAADLRWGGSMGLALIGEGQFLGQVGSERSAEVRS